MLSSQLSASVDVTLYYMLWSIAWYSITNWTGIFGYTVSLLNLLCVQKVFCSSFYCDLTYRQDFLENIIVMREKKGRNRPDKITVISLFSLIHNRFFFNTWNSYIYGTMKLWNIVIFPLEYSKDIEEKKKR